MLINCIKLIDLHRIFFEHSDIVVESTQKKKIIQFQVGPFVSYKGGKKSHMPFIKLHQHTYNIAF